ncbi:SRPBCC family protein [Chryseobacterium foetidum]|uniref:SRPBCC family protein n=1 Tax=Chryseobacterium foetidum TaxID=2951057 RepID=UPI0021C90349|nr:SRPBCC family protein [Chryseobacterium foetidum]
MVHTLKRTQQLHCDISTAWKFFSAAKNLSEITPDDMNFIVLTNVENQEIYEGMLIDYYVSPLFGVKLKWQTEITQVDKEKSFTDFQKKGPFKLWNHHHEFVPNAEGVLMTDIVTYELPLGFLGETAHKIMVKSKLENIFNYRYKILETKFNQR